MRLTSTLRLEHRCPLFQRPHTDFLSPVDIALPAFVQIFDRETPADKHGEDGEIHVAFGDWLTASAVGHVCDASLLTSSSPQELPETVTALGR